MAATYYDAVDLHAALAFEPVTKVHKLYVANLTQPLQVVTPPVELLTALDAAEPFAFIKAQGRFAEFLKTVEARVLELSVEHKAAWFRKPVDDDALRHNFKSFFGDDGAFKVKAQEVALFGTDLAPAGLEEGAAGRHVRCVLELARVCFGRQEFGAMWRLVQARLVEVPPCLIPEEEEGEEERDAEGSEEAPEGPEDGGGDPEELEFL